MSNDQVWALFERMQGEIAREIRNMLGEPPYDQSLFDEAQRQRRIESLKLVADDPRNEAERHEAWREKHLAEGWTQGDEFKPEIKQHTNLVPFAELPATTQSKVRIFDIVAKYAKAASTLAVLLLVIAASGCATFGADIQDGLKDARAGFASFDAGLGKVCPQAETSRYCVAARDWWVAADDSLSTAEVVAHAGQDAWSLIGNVWESLQKGWAALTAKQPVAVATPVAAPETPDPKAPTLEENPYREPQSAVDQLLRGVPRSPYDPIKPDLAQLRLASFAHPREPGE